jgi:hypothetical protein
VKAHVAIIVKRTQFRAKAAKGAKENQKQIFEASLLAILAIFARNVISFFVAHGG